MRLDLFLKASRLCPRRAVAQALCEAGAVAVNGARAKPARAIRVGDEITLRRPNRLLTVRIIALPLTKQTSRGEASTLYQITGDIALESDSIFE
jgi:ribosome-associated heat shock protein Hsp15